MAKLTCASCGREVAGVHGAMCECGALLAMPGAVVDAAEPTEALVGVAAGGPDVAAGPTLVGTGPGGAEFGAGVPGERVACRVRGCGEKAMRGKDLCRRHFVEVQGRDFVLMAPWGGNIIVPDGESVGLGRHPDFSPYAAEIGEYRCVGRQHAFVHSDNGQLFVRDLSSHNGTRRNGYPIPADAEVELVPGDTLTLGGEIELVVA